MNPRQKSPTRPIFALKERIILPRHHREENHPPGLQMHFATIILQFYEYKRKHHKQIARNEAREH